MADIPPSQTLYVSNLYDKIKKDELKKALHAAFSQFGKLLDIVVVKTYRLRGQAWVVFGDVASATNALRAMEGFPFMEKPMKLSYAKTKSDAVAKLDGTFQPTDRTGERKKRELEDREKSAAAAEAKKARGNAPAPKKEAAAAATPAAPKAAPAATSSTIEPQAPPHFILFVQGLPEATTEPMLSMLFRQFPGFKEVRLVAAKPGIAFVEFENEMQAGVALQGLNGFKITQDNAMTITYAKQ
mmetsp:Transcript_28517/g.93181  ORF Transcript_28517/g.93181 Transcript_28517/m.93181 type:complete len:242 (-) Transcript_28517:75-800(-)